MRVAAVGDLHCKKNSTGQLASLFKSISENANILLLCGDLTDYGTVEEAQVLVKQMAPALHLPTLAVLGNHDFESDKQDDVKSILTEAGITVLDGEAVEIEGIGFAGTKGFAGGFGKSTLGAWGEQAIKLFVHEALNESLKLEAALARLRTKHKLVVLHYAPIKGTVEGEPPEIYPFLGTSRLEEPINRHGASVVFHGHAHSGSPAGVTSTGIPVYNVAMPMFRRRFPKHPGYGLFELDLNTGAVAAFTHTLQTEAPPNSYQDPQGQQAAGAIQAVAQQQAMQHTAPHYQDPEQGQIVLPSQFMPNQSANPNQSTSQNQSPQNRSAPATAAHLQNS